MGLLGLRKHSQTDHFRKLLLITNYIPGIVPSGHRKDKAVRKHYPKCSHPDSISTSCWPPRKPILGSNVVGNVCLQLGRRPAPLSTPPWFLDLLPYPLGPPSGSYPLSLSCLEKASRCPAPASDRRAWSPTQLPRNPESHNRTSIATSLTPKCCRAVTQVPRASSQLIVHRLFLFQWNDAMATRIGPQNMCLAGDKL